MKLTKNFLRSLIIEEINRRLNEATEEEIGHLNDVLEIPKSALPFQDIFGDRYRILSSFKSDDPNSPFMQFEKFLNSTGWRFNPDNMGEVIKSITSSYIANPDDGVQHRTKEEKLSIIKWVQDLRKYLDSVPQTMDEWQKTILDMREYVEKNFSDGKPVPAYRRASGFKPEYLKDKNYLNMFRKRLALKKSIMKFLPAEASMQVFANISKVRWGRGEETDNDVEDFFKLSNLKDKAGKQSQWLMSGAGGSNVKNYEFFEGKKLDEYKSSLGETEYVVFSRHPIDVFRMSDHQGMSSCHSLPSSDYKGNVPNYDQYNICALAEAHANGMIAYALNPDQFEEPPTQELLDQYEDEEFFSDDQRGIEGFSPVSRVRIKNVGFLADKGDYSEVLTRVAVPEKRTYGDTVPGFMEHVSKVLSNTQRTKIQDIVDKFSGNIDLRRFLRVGGSYEDNSMTQMIPEFFGQVLDRKDLEFDETVQYSNDLQQSLKDEYATMDIDSARQTLNDLKHEYSGGRVDFSQLGVDQDWNGEGFYMTGEVLVVMPYGDEIEFIKPGTDVSDLMSDAMTDAEEMYFYDENWFREYTTTYHQSAYGYTNVCIIQVGIHNFSEEHNEDYFPYDPDAWMYALSSIADFVNSVTDPAHDDNLQEYIKQYISYYSKGEVRTNISEKFYMTTFKETLEEDSNWNIDDLEVDEDNAIGIEVVESFTAEYSDSVWLQDLFDSINDSFDPDNPELVEMAKRLSNHIATLTSMLTSDGMNILKAGLIHQEFYNNQNLYSGLSRASKLNELEMNVQIEVGGNPDISPENILQGIVDNEEYSVTIKITCENWDAPTIQIVGNMMLGEFNNNTGWHVDAEECMTALVRADIHSISQQREPEGLQEIIRKEVLKLLQAR